MISRIDLVSSFTLKTKRSWALSNFIMVPHTKTTYHQIVYNSTIIPHRFIEYCY